MTVAELKFFLEYNNIPDNADIKVSGLDGIDILATCIAIEKPAPHYGGQNFGVQPKNNNSITIRAIRGTGAGV